MCGRMLSLSPSLAPPYPLVNMREWKCECLGCLCKALVGFDIQEGKVVAASQMGFKECADMPPYLAAPADAFTLTFAPDSVYLDPWLINSVVYLHF